VATWFRLYDADEDLCLYFEAGADGWATRRVELRGVDLVPVAAANLLEVLELRDHDDLVSLQQYKQRFGVLAEASLDGWRQWPGAQEITQPEFERCGPRPGQCWQKQVELAVEHRD